MLVHHILMDTQKFIPIEEREKGKGKGGKKKELNRRIGKSESAFSDNREFSFTLKFEQ